MTNITNSQNTKRTYGQLSEQLKNYLNEFNELNCHVFMDKCSIALVSIVGKIIVQAGSGVDVSEILCISKVILRDGLCGVSKERQLGVRVLYIC